MLEDNSARSEVRSWDTRNSGPDSSSHSQIHGSHESIGRPEHAARVRPAPGICHHAVVDRSRFGEKSGL